MREEGNEKRERKKGEEKNIPPPGIKGFVTFATMVCFSILQNYFNKMSTFDVDIVTKSIIKGRKTPVNNTRFIAYRRRL